MDLFYCKSKAFYKMLIDGLNLCGLLVDYCFISCLDSHFDGTHSLHWNKSLNLL